VNLYKLFLEQAVNVLAANGHCGILMPGSVYTDLGSRALREMLFDNTQVQSLFGLSNEKFIFQDVHHAQKFCILTFKKGATTPEFEAAFRINPREAVHPDQLDSFLHSKESHVTISAELIRQLSPDSVSVLEFKSPTDVEIAKKTLRFPLLGGQDNGPWNLSFSQEFNMTTDGKRIFGAKAKDSLPVFEGKMIWQFDHCFAPLNSWVDEAVGRKTILGRHADNGQNLSYQAFRLAHRRQSASTNERTFVSTILPAKSFHADSMASLVVVDDSGNRLISDMHQLFLCALWNSFVVDYVLRQRVTNNINFFHVKQLRVPFFPASSPAVIKLARRVGRLVATDPKFDDLVKSIFGGKSNHKSCGVTESDDRYRIRAEIDALVAQLYDLTQEELEHILSTFPLVSKEVKTLTSNTFIAMSPSADDKAVHKLIKGLETDKVELKEAAAFSAQRNQKSPDVIGKVVREVAAFRNSGGGNVIIGATDAGKIVGIANDIQHADPKKKNRDGYELFLRNSISGKLGTLQSAACKISFHKIENQEVCRILVPAASAPVCLDDNLIIRDGTSSRQLNTEEAADYIAQAWPQP
jgi:Schlafen, AlbA_2